MFVLELAAIDVGTLGGAVLLVILAIKVGIWWRSIS